jgi:hypothetical protein
VASACWSIPCVRRPWRDRHWGVPRRLDGRVRYALPPSRFPPGRDLRPGHGGTDAAGSAGTAQCRTTGPRAGEAGVLPPRSQRQRPYCITHDRGRRAGRTPDAGAAGGRIDQREHGHWSRDRLCREGLPVLRGDVGGKQCGTAADAACPRRYRGAGAAGRREPSGPGVAGRPGSGGGACRSPHRRPRRVPAQSVHQSE